MNPILQQINSARMNPLQAVGMLKNMMTGKNPQEVVNYMMKTNPQFARFAEQFNNKSAEQIASENGIDMDILRSILN